MTRQRRSSSWIEEIGEVLFPPSCVMCCSAGKAVDGGLCTSCMAEVAYVTSPLCRICGQNFTAATPGDHLCGGCLRNTPPFSLARSITFYEEPVRTLLHRLKYNFDTTVTDPLLKIARNYDFSHFETSEYIVPVPVHSQRLRKRGLNHALHLARIIFSERSQDIMINVLLKKRKTSSQTALDAARRKTNLRAAFVIKNADIIKNKKICVVDDVYTTGTTVRECAATLMRAGAADVSVVTFARVRKK